MGETVLKFLLGELKTVRITCKHKDCGAVLELPVNRLESAFRDFKCPLCHSEIRSNANTEDVFDLLGRAVRKFNEPEVKSHIEIEFVIPAKN